MRAGVGGWSGPTIALDREITSGERGRSLEHAWELGVRMAADMLPDGPERLRVMQLLRGLPPEAVRVKAEDLQDETAEKLDEIKTAIEDAEATLASASSDLRDVARSLVKK